MKQLACAALLSAGLMAYGDTVSADVAAVEAKLKNDIMTIVNQVNPIDSTTGQRKYISFGFISDIHKCKRVPGDDDPVNPVTDYWYGSAGILTEAEQSIRLLGSLAQDSGIDAIINGGDLSTAPVMGSAKGLTEVEYTNEIWNVKAMFDRHIPSSVPLFTVDGNHERSYSINGANMHMTDEAWAYVLTNFNTSASVAHARDVDVTYHRDLANATLGNSQKGKFAGNSYHLDFRRLYATKGINVRIACLSAYDNASGSDLRNRVFDAAQFYDAAGNQLTSGMTPENTIMGMVAHGAEETVGVSARSAAGSLQCGYMNSYSNPSSKGGPWNGGNHKGLGFFGLVAAHYHFVTTKEITDAFDNLVNGDNKVYASAVSVASAHAANWPAKPSSHELGTEAAYHFSIFVIDTDNNLMREVRLGGWTSNPVVHEQPVVQLHDFNIRTQLDKSGPVVGSVSVSPSITSATLSGSLSSVGSDATACDVYLALNGGAAIKIASGVTGAFSYELTDLTAETTYSYTLTVSNNATAVKSATKTGSFTTQAAPKAEPVLGTVTVTPAVTSAALSGAIASVGLDATACDVYLAVGTSADSLGAATKIATGATDTFSYTIPGLTAKTTYYYELSVENNAATSTRASTTGSFRTRAEPGEGIEPGESASANVQTIQAAIDAAAQESPVGTVTLGEGVFEVDQQLTVHDGVTLSGQGYENTTLKYVGKQGANSRVATLSGGSSLVGVTVTGGNVSDNNTQGGGLLITGGGATVSWCRITGNTNMRTYGGGIGITGTGMVKIDHTIVAQNAAAPQFNLDAAGGGIGVRADGTMSLEIDSCLVTGNVAGHANNPAHGGGIAICRGTVTAEIRNTTIANNELQGQGLGGGLYTAHANTTLTNCIIADNTVLAGDANVGYASATVQTSVEGKTSNCLIGGTTAFLGAGDYHLSAAYSAAVGQGAARESGAKDLDGNAYAAHPSIGCYEYAGTDPVDPPAPTVVEPGLGAMTAEVVNGTNVTVTISNLTLGTDDQGVAASSCSVYFAVKNKNGTEIKSSTVKTGLTASSYSFTIKDFAEDGNYTCEVTITTDKGKTATKSAAFTIATPVEPDPGPGPGPEPGEGLAPVEGDNAASIQAAIDAAAPEHGTVTLGAGTFEVQSQLMLTNGVTLVGQGMDKTVIKYVVVKSAKTEVVVSLSGSSTLKDLTVTGGNNANGNNNTHGGGVSTNGDVGDTITISWCRITDNCNQRGFGGGIYVAGKGNVTIDHTIVSDNRAATSFSLTSYGGGIGIQSSAVTVTIDSCLVSGNTIGNGSNASQKGAGIGVKNAASVTIRNTTIAGNTVASATGTGGGIHSDKALSLVNCIVADNIVSTGDANVSFYTDAIKNTSATTSSNCVFGNGTAAFGANSVSVASVGFVGTGDYHLAEGSAAIGAGSTYVGLANDLDDKAFAATPSAGCYEYGSVTPPAPEWDVPGTTGGIQAIDDGAGHKRINITSFAIVNGQLTLGFEAAKVDADGQTFALVCKENLTDTETFTLNVTLTNGEASNLGSLAGQTDKSQLFILGIESANAMITGN